MAGKRSSDNQDDHLQLSDQAMNDTMTIKNQLKRQATGPAGVQQQFSQAEFNAAIGNEILSLGEGLRSITSLLVNIQNNVTLNKQINNTTIMVTNANDQPEKPKPTSIYIDNKAITYAKREDLENQLEKDQTLTDVLFNKIIWAKSGKLIIIELDGDAQLDLVEAHLTSKNIPYQLTNPETKVDKRFVLLGFRSTIEERDLITNLLAKEKNRPALNAQNVKLLKYHRNANACYAIIGYCDQAAELIASPNQNFHHVGTRKITIFRYTEISTCAKCSNFHQTKTCKATDYTCAKCAGNHLFDEKCKTIAKCANCLRAGNDNASHSAFFIGCPARKAKMNSLIAARGF